MPLDIIQKLDIKNTEKRISLNSIKSFLFNSGGFFDFNKIIPKPEYISLNEKAAPDGLPQEYHWNVKNWGTKWNVYDFQILEDTEDKLSFRFSTANSMPKPILKKVFELLKGCKIIYKAVDEIGRQRTHIEINEDGTEEKVEILVSDAQLS